MNSALIFQVLLGSTLIIYCVHSYDGLYGDLNTFRQKHVVPDIIPKVPDSALQVTYNGHEVECGSHVEKSSAKDPPALYYESDSGKLYALLMFDPDGPTPQNNSLSPVRHWIIENIPGNDVSAGDVASKYFSPAPPRGSDPHRYVILIYEHPGNKKLDDHYTDKRTNFDINDFVESRNLQGPVAGNFFLIGPD